MREQEIYSALRHESFYVAVIDEDYFKLSPNLHLSSVPKPPLNDAAARCTAVSRF